MTSNAINDFADTFGITLMNQAQAALAPELRELHRAVLSAFVDTGSAPTVAWIIDQASLLGLDPAKGLATLADADLVHTTDGIVAVAYPFSGSPTPHRVEFDGGPAAWAMCGADALGIPLMTGRNATITSADPHTGDPIRIRYDEGTWTWEPADTVMLMAATHGCETAADAACRHIHFFAGPEHAQAYLAANPTLSGEIFDQAGSIEASRIVFGPLLGR